MSDLISLSCPNCGGKLEIAPDTQTLQCQFCGIEHIVRHQDNSIFLESFARCSRCRRNDRVEKVSAICRSNPQFTGNFQLPDKPNQQAFPPLPSEPQRPEFRKLSYKGNSFIPVYIIDGIILIALYGASSSAIRAGTLNVWAFLVTLTFVGGLFLVAYQGEKSMIQKWNQKLDDQYKQDYKAYQINKSEAEKQISDIIRENKEKLEKWEKARTRWNQLYYCHRDDVIFIPGTMNTSSPDAIADFLFQ